MAPTESEILTNYLLQPAALTAIVTFAQFQALFPSPIQASPQLRTLFRDLQAQRNGAVDAVAANVAAEAKRGVAMRREVIRLRRDAEHDEADAELEMERMLFGDGKTKQTLTSMVPEIDGAVLALEAETKRLQDEESALLGSVKQIIGGLSDLRYGKLANRQLRDEVLDGLDSLQAACDGKS
ncbi:hypothetical protein DCS_07270 [Drechmeria coniospora]|uniref:Cnl2/NKP2 family protein n=1 Tax=Drechmeria coniospora TaxID=98403 RepID=A0A151GDZ3_DRECN|nr:hypothetical protein DCS_07270 [Drechmeria coniospora]KYK55307.1 hypothetical protein DCS_07270 [Drechmeria coniospora]ODA82078.1 hypothetical protein RJ55_00583 [Drechmeria coniospora]